MSERRHAVENGRVPRAEGCVGSTESLIAPSRMTASVRGLADTSGYGDVRCEKWRIIRLHIRKVPEEGLERVALRSEAHRYSQTKHGRQ